LLSGSRNQKGGWMGGDYSSNFVNEIEILPVNVHATIRGEKDEESAV